MVIILVVVFVLMLVSFIAGSWIGIRAFVDYIEMSGEDIWVAWLIDLLAFVAVLLGGVYVISRLLAFFGII